MSTSPSALSPTTISGKACRRPARSWFDKLTTDALAFTTNGLALARDALALTTDALALTTNGLALTTDALARLPFQTEGSGRNYQGNRVFQGWSCILLSFAPCQAWRPLSRMSSMRKSAMQVALGNHNPAWHPGDQLGLAASPESPEMTGNGRKNEKQPGKSPM